MSDDSDDLETIFGDDSSDDSPSRRISKSEPVDSAIKESGAGMSRRTGDRECDLSRGDVPTYVNVPPLLEIELDERTAALVENPFFVCHGHDHNGYQFKSKISGQWIVTSDFEKARILELAPRTFWETWSATGAFEPDEIMDALIRLAQKTGRRQLVF